jgi:hypothetical protein
VVAVLASACSPGALDGPTTPANVPTSTGTTSTILTASTAGTATTVPIEPATDAEVVGYVGCSVIINAADGYQAEGGTRLWSTRLLRYSGGIVGRWAADLSDQSPYWSTFQTMLEEQPPDVIWWGLCSNKGPADQASQARTVLEEIRRRALELAVFASGQPAYTEGHVCEISGAEGPARMQELVDEMVAAGLVARGPVLGPLAAEQTRDGCHANEDGQRLMGDQLVDFFG